MFEEDEEVKDGEQGFQLATARKRLTPSPSSVAIISSTHQVRRGATICTITFISSILANEHREINCVKLCM